MATNLHREGVTTIMIDLETGEEWVLEPVPEKQQEPKSLRSWADHGLAAASYRW